MPSFPFFDLHHVLERPPPRVLHQFVMVLVARFSMSVAEIVMAYALVRPHDAATTTRNPAPATRSPYYSPNTSLHAMIRWSKHVSSTQA